MSEWKEVTLKGITKLVIDYRGKTPLKLGGNWSEHGYRALSAKNVKTGIIVAEESIRYVDEVLYKKWMKDEVQRGDILITSEAPFGEVFFWDSDEKIVLSQRLFDIRVKKDVYPKYVYYYMTSYPFQAELRSRASGTTVLGLKQPELLKATISLPKYDTQVRIASILSALDDKIAVNRRICENLEAQAQALFKHWFIDFAPFKDGKFVESELGMIPEGWKVGTLGDIADINPSRSLKKGTLATYLDMKNMPTSGSFPSSWEEKEFAGGMKFKNGDTLMARITPCLENGKVAYVNFLKDEEIAFGSTEYIVMTAKENVFPELLYTLCRFPSFVSYATKNMNGSSGRQRVSGETISNFQMIIAPDSVYKIVQPLFNNYMELIRECGFENLRLASLRDTLLPKLMSGQIKL